MRTPLPVRPLPPYMSPVTFRPRPDHPMHRPADMAKMAIPGRRDGGRGGIDTDDRDTGTGTLTKTRTRTKKPALYKVLMLNDDYTPMEFVVLTLQRFFKMTIEDATRVMLHVHQRGVGICGVFTYEVAETKVSQVIDFAREHQHPLQCTLEKD